MKIAKVMLLSLLLVFLAVGCSKQSESIITGADGKTVAVVKSEQTPSWCGTYSMDIDGMANDLLVQWTAQKGFTMGTPEADEYAKSLEESGNGPRQYLAKYLGFDSFTICLEDAVNGYLICESPYLTFGEKDASGVVRFTYAVTDGTNLKITTDMQKDSLLGFLEEGGSIITLSLPGFGGGYNPQLKKL